MDDASWQTVLRRDRRQDGIFVWVALTTGIYCRPSCPARRPYRRHALVVGSAAEAERMGFAACRRCHPNALAPVERSIHATLMYLEANLDRPVTLDTLSEVSGLSPNHLQKTFQRIVGLSPKAFCDARRLVRFKDALRLGESISDACYRVGYGSSRALYERVATRLGMTPAAYQRGGDGITIRFATIGSILGCLLIARTGTGICTIAVGKDEEAMLKRLRDEFPAALLRRAPAPYSWAAVIESCQRLDPLLVGLPLEFRVGIFQARVWKSLGGRSG
jgi:AraC family transcriptional regulator, regulatory protein of adaptative response / methylated-DNA-[protein]-cysteine methyltransferase